MEKKPHPALAAVRVAFPSTVPVLTGYLVLGIAYGVLMQTKGYGVPWVLLMCCLAYEENAYEYLNSGGLLRQHAVCSDHAAGRRL